MKFKHLLNIEYVLYEILDKEANTSNLVVKHSISSEKILEHLQRKNFILRKEDIITLLKQDSAHFFEDSVRIFDPEMGSYFQLSNDFYEELDPEDLHLDLKLWMKSTHPNFRRRLEDLTTDVKSLKDSLKKLTESIPNQIQNAFQELNKEVQNLKLMNQIFFKQLKDIRLPKSGEGLVQQNEGQVDEPRFESVQIPDDEPALSFSNSSEVIDIALMYSEPLVRSDPNGIQSLGEPVEFEEECNELIQVLKSKGTSVSLYFEIASYENMVTVLSLKPTILHIICHGDYNKSNGQFYLCFEHDAELREFYSEDLREILKDVSHITKLVFVNACHSEEVAKVFHKAGVPCVIAVQSELKIDDIIAKKFSKAFYKYLVEGKTINEAFTFAQRALKADTVYTCCCAHSHEDDCEWYKMAKAEGFEKAHYFHTRNCMECKDPNRFLHNPECKWVLDFMNNVCQKFDVSTEEMIHACCCKPGLEHDERMKFTLFYKDEKAKNQVLFQPSRPKGPVNIKSSHSCVEQKFPVKRLTGRTIELYNMFGILTDKLKRYVIFYGSEGVGKSTFVKQLSNYLWERGYFQDKISIIILDKMPTTAGLQSALFKEIEGSYDLKTFCESVKTRNMLFIIENCDKLIENHKQDLIAILGYIRANAINVKFIFVTSQELKLGIGESRVLMKGFKKIEAAKVLAQSAYTYLSYRDKNPYTLQDHKIFDYFPLTPQGIWAICELLKGTKGKSLDEIVRDKEFEKKEIEDNLSEKDEITRLSLEKIKISDPEAYHLLLFICLFPSGLSFRDLHEMERQQRIPKNWQKLMFFLLNRDNEKEVSNSLTTSLNPESPDKYTYFRCDNYFWLSVAKDSVEDDLYFTPSQFVSRYIEQNLFSDISALIVKKFEYLAIMAKTMVDKMLFFYEYNEKLLEFSAVSNNGIWKSFVENDFDINDPKNIISYFGSSRECLLKMKKTFSLHEGNFSSCFDLQSLENIFKHIKIILLGDNLDTLAHRLEVVLFNIVTLFKVMLRDADAKDLAVRAGYIVDGYIHQQRTTRKPYFYALKIKLLLFLASLYLTSKRDLDNSKKIVFDETKNVSDFSIISIYLDDAERANANIIDETIKAFFNFEIKLAKTSLFLKTYKKTGKPDIPNQKFYQEFKKKILECESILPHSAEKSLMEQQVFQQLPDLDKENQPNLICKAKLCMLKIKGLQKYWPRDLDKPTFDNLRLSAVTFKIYGADKLLMKANYASASLRLLLEIRSDGTSKSSNKILAEVKTQYLIKSALEIAKKISDKSFESRIKKKIDDFNHQIRKGYFNVLLLMRASPLVESSIILDAANPKLCEELKDVGFPIRTVSTFKSDLIDTLNRRSKALSLGFEILTREKLIDALDKGCRILQLNCYNSDAGLALEGEYGKMDRMDFQEIQEIFKKGAVLSSANNQLPQQESKVFDILILGIKNSQKLCSFFIEQLNLQHIIAFEFSSLEFDLKHKTYEDECTDKFCIYFYEELIQEKTIQEAFEHAKQKTYVYLSDKYFEGKKQEHIQKIIGAGPKLLPEGQDHSERIFHSDQFPLLNGKIVDISSTRYPSNLARFQLPFVGRNKDIHLLMKRIYEKRGFLKIPGPAGGGKTAFVMQTAYYLLTRDKFKDGIYYLPMKRIKQNQNSAYDLSDLLKETFGLEVSNPLNFFRDKDMLLIFDDFDYFYEKDAEFPRLLFIQLRECKITCVFVTTSNVKQATKKKKKEDTYYRKKEEIEKDLGLEQLNKWRFRALNKEELANMVIALAKPDKHLELNPKRIMDIPIIEGAMGNPKLVIDRLIEGKLEYNRKKIEINPIYEKLVNLDSKYLHVNKVSNSSVALTRTSSSITQTALSDTATKLNRTISESVNPNIAKKLLKQIYPSPTELKSAKSTIQSSSIASFNLISDDDKSVRSQPQSHKRGKNKKNHNDQPPEFPPSRFDFHSHEGKHIDEASFEEEKSHNATHSKDEEFSAGEKSISGIKMSDERTPLDTSVDDIDYLDDSFFPSEQMTASEESHSESETEFDKISSKKNKPNEARNGGAGGGKKKKQQSGKQARRYGKNKNNKYNNFKDKKNDKNDDDES